jgi:hypothetical protein
MVIRDETEKQKRIKQERNIREREHMVVDGEDDHDEQL